MDLGAAVVPSSGMKSLHLVAVGTGDIVGSWNSNESQRDQSAREIGRWVTWVADLHEAGNWDQESTTIHSSGTTKIAVLAVNSGHFAVARYGLDEPIGIVLRGAAAVRGRILATLSSDVDLSGGFLLDDTPTGPIKPLVMSDYASRAAHVMQRIRRHSPDPETTALRIAVRSRVSLDRMSAGDDLSEDEITRVEAFADELLND